MAYEGSWDRLHQPNDHIEWQESDCYWFYDSERRVGGFHRIGQKVNKKTGQIMLLVFAEGGERFSMYDNSPKEDYLTGPDSRTENGQRVRNHTAQPLGDGRMRYTWEEDGSTADLEFYEKFHTPMNWPGGEGATSALNPGGHLEVGGRIRGVIKIGKKRYEIDGLAHRDRSWGVREGWIHLDWRRYRMVSGTLGPALSFAAFTLDKAAGGRVVTGHAIRNGKKNVVTDLRVLTTFDADGYTTMGATALLTLDSGEILRLECEAVQGFMSKAMGKTFLTDTICKVTWEGHTGFCDIELSPSPTRGDYIPTPEDGSLLCIGERLTKAASYELPASGASVRRAS